MDVGGRSRRLRRKGSGPAGRRGSIPASGSIKVGDVLCTIVSIPDHLESRAGRDFSRFLRPSQDGGHAMTHDYVMVLTTLPTDADGVAFARSLVEERLAACVNLLAPMESVYRWDDNIETEAERQVVIKTSRERVAALWDRVREVHPYDVPEFIVLPIVDGNDAYLRWVGESTT